MNGKSNLKLPQQVARQLVDMRADLLAPIEAMVSFSEMLLEDTADRPPQFREDVLKLHATTRDLHKFVKSGLDIGERETTEKRIQEELGRLRHDIGNRLNQVLGYCQLMIMEDQEVYFGALSEDLSKICDYCRDCEAKLLHYRESKPAKVAPRHDPPHSLQSVPPATKPTAVEPAVVLVADDNEAGRDVLVQALQREGHHVWQARNGREALDLAEQEEFDLILLDFLMPELSGYEVLSRLKADERMRHTPVMLVSALDAVRDMVPCIERGAEDFLTKPVDLAMLRARVNACLEKKRLREREFGQFFTPELARHYVRHPELLKAGREAEVTVMFCDIRGFSKISEHLDPSETVEWVSDVMGALSDAVLKHRGVLVDYIGDELMAMWGAPEQQPDHAELSCQAAIEMLTRLPELSDRWESVTGQPTRVGIGLNSGLAQVGNTGSHRKFKYGPLGNTVNIASRVQGATKYLKAELVVTGTTWQQLGLQFTSRRLCKARVVNIEQPVDLYEVVCCDTDRDLSSMRSYEEALKRFESEEFRAAAAILGRLLVECPHDGASLMLMSRVIEALLHESEPFDAVWELPGK